MNTKPAIFSIARFLLALTILAGLLHQSTLPALAASQFEILGPAGSVRFGTSVTVLPNGNIVVADPAYNGGIGADAGAVYLYNGATGAVISTLSGLAAGNQVGSGGVVVLKNGNYVVRSPFWDNGLIVDAGAVTWGDGVSGITGAVSAANSLVGSQYNDQVGSNGVTALSNGNYLVLSPFWDNGARVDVGAVTWGSGTGGVIGAVSALNSLVGSTASDGVGGAGVIQLTNGNYVVTSVLWNNGGILDAGAVTWGSGTGGVTGAVTALNSLVGSTASDQVGLFGATALSNGNYVVSSPAWNNGFTADAGAATWGNGLSGVTGLVSSANSLVGSTALDRVGSGLTALSNGNYVVRSRLWNNGGILEPGAITWGNGASGIVGQVSAANSLVGSTSYDQVGSGGVTALSNGNYVVLSLDWDNGAVVNAGAVTWGSGTGGVTGAVTALNSLVGSQTSDLVGGGYVTALSNGNYVVSSPYWNHGAIADAGAVTWGDGTSGVTGTVTVTNSLVGSQASDQVGSGYVTALSNGNYVVSSPYWDNGLIVSAGAVTWGDGLSGVTGAVTALNSLVGSTASDQVGSFGATALSNGNYVVRSPSWDNGLTTVLNAGAVTWGDGESGVVGPVTALNSLVGSKANDGVGYDGVTALSNGNYVVGISSWDNASVLDVGAVTWGDGLSGVSGPVTNLNSLVGSTASDRVGSFGVAALINGSYAVHSSNWDNGIVVDAGAISWGFRSSGAVGPISADNSVRGLDEGGGYAMVFQYDGANRQLVVGRPFDNIVTLFRLDSVYLPVVSK